MSRNASSRIFLETPLSSGAVRRVVEAAVVVFLGVSAAPLAGQDPEPWDPGYEPPRTEHGHPDLQGNWTNVTITPLERDEDVEGRTFSWVEVQRLEGAEEARFLAGLEPSDPDRPELDVASSPGGYNRVYIDRGEKIAVVDGEFRTSLVTLPADGRIPGFSEEGRRRMDGLRAFEDRFGTYDHPELRPLGERCVASFGSSLGPPMVPNNFYNNNYTIVQDRDHVLILAEMVHDTRIVRLGEAEPTPDHIRPWFGVSWGRWDGKTLVVETTNIHPRQEFRGVPPSGDRRVIERFTRVDDDTILYEFEIHDPTVYAEPWGGEIPMERFDQQIYEYACHEGNYALQNILSGARYQERTSEDQDRR